MFLTRRSFIIASLSSAATLKAALAQDVPIGNLASFAKSCDLRISPAVVRTYDVLADRLPRKLDHQDLPSKCKDALSKLRQNWIDDDFSKVDSLVNSYCSHLAGWVEIIPGICQAGGPPPICPENHWRRDPLSMNQWHESNRDLRQARDKEQRKLLCSCMTDAMQAEMEQIIQPSLTSEAGAGEKRSPSKAWASSMWKQ